jgi:hypothetical protein
LSNGTHVFFPTKADMERNYVKASKKRIGSWANPKRCCAAITKSAMTTSHDETSG